LKYCKKCDISKDESLFGKSKNRSDGLRSVCKICNNSQSAQWKQQNYDQYLLYNMLWAHQNPELVKISKDTRRRRNLSKFAAKESNRRAAKLQRTPKWLTTSDLIEIQWAFDIAKDMTTSTGIKHEVDHIIPLRGDNISGLHCPQNLRIITKSENSSKRNRY
jgi:hypothetical protein